VNIIKQFLNKGHEPESNSLSDQLTSLEWIEATRDAALQLWRSSVMAVSDSMPSMPKQISDPHRKGLKQLVDEMPVRPAPQHFEQRRAKTAEILKSYGTQMTGYLETQDHEARAVLTSVAQLTQALSGFDQRYSVRLQGITKKLKLLATANDLTEIRTKLAAEVAQLEKCLEEQQKDTRGAVSRITDEVNSSEVRRAKASPGPGSQLVTDGLLALDKAISGWDRYCIVRYDFYDRSGTAPDIPTWKAKESTLQQALPERVGHPVRVFSPKAGVLLAAVQCQLLEYAGQAESMEKSLATTSGLTCLSRVVEPLRGEPMREAMLRLEKAS
jgi:hypothetical protein